MRFETADRYSDRDHERATETVGDDMRAALAFLDGHRQCDRCRVRPSQSVRGDGTGRMVTRCAVCLGAEQRQQAQSWAVRRELDALEQEVRADAAGGFVTGFAAVYGLSAWVKGEREHVAWGAFARSLHGRDVFACVDHDAAQRIGSTADGTLRLFDDPGGLRFELDARSTDARAHGILERAARGEFRGASVAFRPVSSADADRRTIREARLVEVSLMGKGRPAYRDTFVGLADDAMRARISRMNRAALDRELTAGS